MRGKLVECYRALMTAERGQAPRRDAIDAVAPVMGKVGQRGRVDTGRKRTHGALGYAFGRALGTVPSPARNSLTGFPDCRLTWRPRVVRAHPVAALGRHGPQGNDGSAGALMCSISRSFAAGLASRSLS